MDKDSDDEGGFIISRRIVLNVFLAVYFSVNSFKVVFNYFNVYNKEDFSSNFDFGYSSKIFGIRVVNGNFSSNSGILFFFFSTDIDYSLFTFSNNYFFYFAVIYSDYE